MHMKRNLWIIALVLWTINAQALIVSVNGQGDIPATGMELTIDEAEEDLLSGEMVMKVEGNLLTNNPLTVSVSRTSAGLVDEFCCAGQCRFGNGETTEELQFQPTGLASWYIHYTPQAGTNETITYSFDDEESQAVLVIHFKYPAQGVESIQHSEFGIQKVLRDGIIYIIKDNKTYTIL